MGEICPKCGLPKEICACEALEKEEAQRIKIYTTTKKFRKLVTVIEGLGKDEMTKAVKELKRKLACGGTAKGDAIVLQGDHKKKLVDILVDMGYNRERIDVR